MSLWVQVCPFPFHLRIYRTDPAALKGTYIYTEDSSICKAAIHSGVIDDSGGEIVVIRAITQSTFYSSVMNGVTSLGSHQITTEFKAGAFLVSRATKHILSKQMKLHRPSAANADPKPLTGQDTTPGPPRLRWLPDLGWKGFNGNALDFVNLHNYPNSDKVKVLRDFTFILQITATGEHPFPFPSLVFRIARQVEHFVFIPKLRGFDVRH